MLARARIWRAAAPSVANPGAAIPANEGTACNILTRSPRSDLSKYAAAMAQLFQTHPEPVEDLLAEVEARKLALPEFQRNFKWEPERTAALLSSIMARYPAGSLLMWQPKEISLEVRAIADAPEMPAPLEPGLPGRLVLDGQQRITALYRAIEGKTEETYFVALSEFIDEESFELREPDEINWDAAVVAMELSAAERKALKKDKIQPQHRTEEWQLERRLYPVGQRFDHWTDGLLDPIEDKDERKRRRDVLRDFETAYLDQLEEYQFPVTTLSDEASLGAVCNVFEKLNTNAVVLGPYEILTAKFFKNGTRLRQLWDDARQTHSVLRDPEVDKDQGGFAIDPYLVLQIVCLHVYGSPQKRVVTSKLRATDVDDHWGEVVLALKRVIEHLRDSQGVIHRDLLPYPAILVPMTGAWLVRAGLDPKKQAAALGKIDSYFWASVFTTNFDQGGASQAEKDYGDLVAWLNDEQRPDGSPRKPEALDTLQITADSLLAATVRKKALLKGVMALTVREGAKDFYKGQPLTQAVYIEEKVNSHHLFPKKRLSDGNASTRIDPGGYNAELVLNRALIDAKTNQRIGAKKPSAYVSGMRDDNDDVETLLSSHLIDAEVLESDEYPTFLMRRLEDLITAIEDVTGVTVTPLTTPEGEGGEEEES